MTGESCVIYAAFALQVGETHGAHLTTKMLTAKATAASADVSSIIAVTQPILNPSQYAPPSSLIYAARPFRCSIIAFIISA